MSDTQEFKVFLIGVAEKDKQMLQRILRVSTGSVRRYVLTDDSSPEPRKLYVVNSDNDQAIAHWCRQYMNPDKSPKVPTVFTGYRKVKGEKIYNILLPFRATQVLSTLDTITVKEMNFIPELTIGQFDEDSNVSSALLEEIANSTSPNGHYQFKAMVVDDSPPVRKQLEIELKMLGAKVECAENGEQAIQLSREEDYDIIFLDVVMPGIDGYKVCKFLKKDIRSKNTPVIMLTGKSSPFDKVKGSLSGCDTYLTKPLQHEDFQNITRKFLPRVNG
ncbi:MAG: response regulator [Gammaproteobacteria bacterium]